MVTQRQQSFFRNRDAKVVAQWNIFLHHYFYMNFVGLKYLITISNNEQCLYGYCKNVHEPERKALKKKI